MNCIPVRRWCLETFHYYVVFTTSIFFILGLIFSVKLVEKTFVNILITRLNDDAWPGEFYDFRRAVVVVNIQEGTTAVLTPLFAYVADVYTGRFMVLVISTTACIIGLMILNFAAAGDDGVLELRLFYPGLGLLALALAAQEVNLGAFLEDQLRPMVLDEEQRNRRTRFWWTLVSLVAAIFALTGPLPELYFKELALVLIAVMGFCFLVFLLGFKCYNFVPKSENPFKDVGIVVRTAIANRNVQCPQAPEPHIPWLRWLDKATEESKCSPEQVRGVKLLLKMLPLWCCLLTLSLVSASGSTYFFEEADSLANNDSDLRAILIFSNLSRLAEFVASETSSYVIRKLNKRKKYNQQKMELVRIGIGTACCLLCCGAAWETAARRQRRTTYAYRHHGPMSAYWLTPQFLLLGLMTGLSQDGLVSFYGSQVSESLWSYGEPLVELSVGVGKFMSVVWLVVFSMRPFGWFQRIVEYSRLDKYYIFMGVLSVVNFVIYWWAAQWYGDDVFLLEQGREMDTLAQQIDGEFLASSSLEEQQHISHPSASTAE